MRSMSDEPVLPIDDNFARRALAALNQSALAIAGELDVDKAVSYTHLRAHETVLDLVCRLLLENKNINTYTFYHISHTMNSRCT